MLSFYFLLKLTYPNGKFKFDQSVLDVLCFLTKAKSKKTINNYLRGLLAKGWIKHNIKTDYYLIKSLDKIRQEKSWNVRSAFNIDFNNYNKIKAVTGAVIFGYLHKDFWRKVKRDRSVTIKGITYHSKSLKENTKMKPAPVSVIGVEKIFDIPRATASRLKIEAQKEGFLIVKKDFDSLKMTKKEKQDYVKYYDTKQNPVYYKGFYRLQLVDLIYPLFYFSKRISLRR